VRRWRMRRREPPQTLEKRAHGLAADEVRDRAKVRFRGSGLRGCWDPSPLPATIERGWGGGKPDGGGGLRGGAGRSAAGQAVG
jgi:hypothetical protein